jgi:TPR repeat protein
MMRVFDISKKKCLLKGRRPGFDLDNDQSLIYLQRAAEGGHAESLFCLAIACMTGEFMPANLEKAVQYLQKAADRGHEFAQCILATLLVKEPNLKLPTHPETSIDHYEKAKEIFSRIQDAEIIVIANTWLDYLQKLRPQKAPTTASSSS